jgi:putative peptidoglycan lipid II flippase
MLYVMLPMTGIAIVMRTELVTILFNYGKFDTRAVALTSDALLFLLFGLAADGLNVLLARAVYSRGGTWPPVISGITELAITVVVGATLVGPWGLPGIALAFSLGAWAETLLLLGAVLAATRAVDVGSLARGAVTFLLAAACATGAAWLAERALYTAGFDAGKLAALVQLVVAGTAGVATYAAISLALRIPELPDTLRLAVGAIRREPPVAA